MVGIGLVRVINAGTIINSVVKIVGVDIRIASVPETISVVVFLSRIGYPAAIIQIIGNAVAIGIYRRKIISKILSGRNLALGQIESRRT